MNSNNFGKNKTLKIVLSLIVFFLAIQLSSAQQMLVDSLQQRKAHIESRENFVKNDTNYIKTLYILARSYLYINIDSSNIIGNRALELSEEIKYKKGIAGAKLALGFSKTFQGQFGSGYEILDESIKIAKNINADSIYLGGLNAMAVGHFKNTKYAEAYRYCRIGIKKSQEFNNHEMKVLFNMNLATFFAILDDPEQALSYYEECLNLLKTKNNERDLARLKSNMGYLFIKTKELEKAKKYLKEAIKNFKKEVNTPWQAFAQVNLGELCILEKKYDSAIILFKDSKKLLKNIYDPQRKAEASLGLSEAYLLKNELEKSEIGALKADSISNSINFHEGSIRAKKLLYEIFKQKNQNEKAVRYFEAFHLLSDSIQIIENRTKLIMLEAKTKFEQEQSLIEEKNSKKLEQQKRITYIAVILFMAVSIILVLIRKNIIAQKKANKKLVELNQIKNRVFSIIGHDLKAPINTMQELLELYNNDAITPEQIAEITPRLKSNVDHSAFTLNNLLFWAQTQMNGITTVFEKVNLKHAADLVCDLYHEQLEKKNITIECSIPKEIVVFMDKEHLNIILRNIISNAIKYSNQNQKITFNAEENEKFLKITICDEGLGMNYNLINDILEGKNLISIPGTNNEKGTGLGLKICKDLLTANNGMLEIVSTPNHGSCFYILLPKA